MKELNTKKEQEPFKIYKVKFYDGFLKDIEINFINKRENMSDIFTSVIIGENGVGKSIILSTLVDIFLELDNYKKGKNVFKSRGVRGKTNNYELEYIIGKNIYSIKKLRGKFEIIWRDITKNVGFSNSSSINDLKLPNAILACSFLVNDKFLFSNKYSENELTYQYLGVRASRTQTNTSSIVKRVANNIILLNNNEELKNGLRECFKFLGLKHEINVIYKIKNKKIFFDGNVTKDNIFEKFEKDLWGKRNVQAFGVKTLKYLKDNPNELQEVVELINQIAEKIKDENRMELKIDLSNESNNKKNEIDLKNIEKLIALDIVSNPESEITKNKSYSLGNGSSGELHILFLITNILSNIKKNSLILIDEPEISLHPSWQIDIISLLKRVLNVCKYDCHIIIATHSHFIVSDLESKSSSLNVLKNIEGHIISEDIQEDTYGWSAENILYNVFGVASSRNYYVATLVEEVVNAIADEQVTDEIKTKINNLKLILPNLKNIDPLKIIIEKILERNII